MLSSQLHNPSNHPTPPSSMADTDPTAASASLFPPKKHTRLPDDTVSYSIFPDFSLSPPNPNNNPTSNLQSLHLQIIQSLAPFTANYIWQHQPFSLSLSTDSPILHLHGSLRYGDNLEDEWFVVFLLFEVSRKFRNCCISVFDNDGEFLLIEAAFHLPRWLNPDTSTNRVFIRGGSIHIIPNSVMPSSLVDSVCYLVSNEVRCIADSNVQLAINNRIKEYPDRARKNMHRVRARVPILVAQILKLEPSLISLAVEGFYDRDIDSMKYAANMERFLSRKTREEFVEVCVVMSRAMYGQLVQQTFQAPKGYPMPGRSEKGYVEAELGMKIACGFEMIYQMRKRDGLEGKGSTWKAFRESLERSGYFQGLILGSKEYKKLMENAEEYYKKSSLHSRASQMMGAPVRCIDEILSLPSSVDDFKCEELPPSDDDSWLYNGEDELNASLMERQKEMELYDLKRKKKHKSKEQQDCNSSSTSNLDDYGLGDIAKSMQAFVQKMSSYEGAEVPENRNPNAVDLDVDSFMKEIESFMKPPRSEEAYNDGGINEDSSSDMDFDESEDESDDDDEEGQTAFMSSYSDVLNEELKATTLDKSFVRANEPPLKRDEGTSNASGDMDEEFTPVDVDVNLVKSFLDSFSSQEGLPGPASNLLGLMGLQLPQDSNKGK